MVVNLDRLLTKRAKSLKASEIRELLKITQVPGLISLGGGLPNPQAFPVEIIHECIEKVFKNHINSALQYGTTEGLPLLRGVLAERMKKNKGIERERSGRERERERETERGREKRIEEQRAREG